MVRLFEGVVVVLVTMGVAAAAADALQSREPITAQRCVKSSESSHALRQEGSPGENQPGERCVFDEHRYRIFGKIQLAMLKIGNDDIGTARMTWRADGGTTTVTLLAGSDPQRAPRQANHWGYIREEVRPDGAHVFALLSPGGGNPVFRSPGTARSGLFSASCSSMDSKEVTSAVASLGIRDLTYRMIDRLLEQLGSSQTWNERRVARPTSADAGFLTAMLRLMVEEAHRPRTGTKPPPVSYVYKGTAYDLSIRDSKVMGRTTVGTRTFDRLIRADFALRSRESPGVTKFSVTYSPDSGPVALPVQITYQPNFWVHIELRLDDQADAPSDPAASDSGLTRIRSICDSAVR